MPKTVEASWKPKHLILDVDGVMTTGHFVYSIEGKVLKVFGPDDHDALLLLRPFLDIRFISGDRKGFPITQKRIADDMKFPLDLVSTLERSDWIRSHVDAEHTIYMGDGIFDAAVFNAVGYGIAPANGAAETKARAHFVTNASGGDRAVAEACLHILSRFFRPFDPDQMPKEFSGSGEWKL